MAREALESDAGHDARFAELEEGLDNIRDEQKTVKKGKALKAKRKVAKTGLVYMSRVPPHMKPNMLRQKMEAHAKIGKIYMVPTQTAPDDLKKELKSRSTQYMKRSREFSEAWIEFLDKEEAETVAEMLNCQPMGGKKRSRYNEDLWNLKYVPDLKWDDLMSEFTYQKKVKEKIFIREIGRAKKERDAYLAEMDRAKKLKAILERKKAKGFEIEEPDFPQHKQRKVQSATVVGEQAGTQPDSQSDESDHVIDFRPENGDELNYEPSSTKGKNKKKRHPDAFLSSHKVQQKRKLLGLDKDGAGGVKAKPSTSISKDVLKMFAT